MAPDRDDAERHKKIVYDLAQVLRDDREAAFVSNAWSVRRISWSAPLVTEFVCTLFLVLVATLPHGAMPNPAFAEATTGVVLVTLGASLSGAHYNPALTLAFLISQGAQGAHSRQWPLYMTLQLVAGVCGAACSAFFTPTPDPYELGGNHCTGVGGLAAFLEEPDTRLNPHGLLWTRSLVSSALATFLLCSWVLYTAELAAPPLGTFGPVSVGLLLFAIIICFGPAAAVFNPAVAVGVWFNAMVCHRQQSPWVLMIYWLVEMAAGFLAGVLILKAKTWTAQIEMLERSEQNAKSIQPVIHHRREAVAVSAHRRQQHEQRVPMVETGAAASTAL